MLKQQGIRVFILSEHCDVEGIESLADKIPLASDEPLSRQLRANVNIKSPALYIYTSGTTGSLCVCFLSAGHERQNKDNNNVFLRASKGSCN